MVVIVRTLLLISLLLSSGVFRLRAGESTEKEAPQKPYLTCLDFQSEFDEGELGRQVGKMFRAKAHRKNVCVVDAEYEWEELRSAMPAPALDAEPVEVAKAAKEAFGSDILIWGEILQPEVAGTRTARHLTPGGKLSHTSTTRTGTRLILDVRAVDLRTDPPRLAVEKTYDLPSNYEISPKIEEVIKLLTGAPTRADLDSADSKHQMKPVGGNLVPHGSLDDLFEGQPPVEWKKALVGWHFPMSEGIEYVNSEVRRSSPDGEIEFSETPGMLHYRISKPVAASTGLFCYTPFIEIEPETYCQASFRVMTKGPKVIMFVKGYRDMVLPGTKDKDGKPVIHRQEVFKHQKRFYGKKGEFGTLTTEPFLPRSKSPEHMPTHIRVQLYAYWPPGEVFFESVDVRKCEPVDSE